MTTPHTPTVLRSADAPALPITGLPVHPADDLPPGTHYGTAHPTGALHLRVRNVADVATDPEGAVAPLAGRRGAVLLVVGARTDLPPEPRASFALRPAARLHTAAIAGRVKVWWVPDLAACACRVEHAVRWATRWARP